MSLDHAADPSRSYLTVCNIQRMSTEDGPGLRTTVFVKGCSLECSWCHNPEGLSPNPQLVWHGPKCIGAGACDAACPEDAISRSSEEIEIDRSRCTVCGDCVDLCPSGAMEQWGTSWSLDDLVGEVMKDRSYFETSGGGVTVSGGEPVLRTTFVASFQKSAASQGSEPDPSRQPIMIMFSDRPDPHCLAIRVASKECTRSVTAWILSMSPSTSGYLASPPSRTARCPMTKGMTGAVFM